MDFELTDDQKMLVETAGSFAKKSSPLSRMRKLRDDELGFEPSVWRQMGELGWLGIPLGEDVGGFGGRFIDAALVLEQLATTLVPEPYLSSVLLGGLAIEKTGTDEQRKRWLAPLCEGKISLALAHSERGSRYEPTRISTRAEKVKGAYRLDGEKLWVLGGHAADVILVSAETDGGPSLFAVDRDSAGLEVRPVKTMDGRRAASVRMQGLEVGGDRLLGGEGRALPALEEVLDGGAAAACAEAVGITRTVLGMTVEYLGTREQFGVPIGSFQALQHRAVDMFVEAELCKSTSLEASLRMDEGDSAERAAAVSAAKVQVSTGGRFVTAQSIQLHGGIGCTDEHDIGLYFKRMQVLASLFGDEEYHVTRFSHLPSFEPS